MNLSPKINRYDSPQSLERLLLLIATLIKNSGIGCADPDRQPDGKHHNALELVRDKLRQIAASLQIELPDSYPAIPTIRKDLELLRDYQILDRRMYRWGYYLGTGVMNKRELKAAFNALESQAVYQGDPELRKIYHTLKKTQNERIRIWRSPRFLLSCQTTSQPRYQLYRSSRNDEKRKIPTHLVSSNRNARKCHY